MDKILCPNCSKEMNFVKAGVSKTKRDPKTGMFKEYEAFFSCPDRECNTTLPVPDDIKDNVTQAYKTPYKGKEEFEKEKADRIQALHDDKKQGINWTSAMGRAVDLVSRHPAFTSLKESELMNAILTFRDLIYREYTQNNNEEVDHSSDDLF